MRLKTIMENLRSDDDHQEALQRTGFWGRGGAGVIPMARTTGRICLAQRSAYVREPGTWSGFGGAIDGAEEPPETAAREFYEETQYRVAPSDLTLIFTYRDINSGFTYFNFLAFSEDEFEPRLNWENQNYAWIDVEDLPSHGNLHFGLAKLSENARAVEHLNSFRNQLMNEKGAWR